MGKAKQNKAQLLKPETKLKILVSSTVYGHEELLESVYSLLTTYGYEVLMSHKGTIPVDPDHSAMDSCLDAVEACDLFLGIICCFSRIALKTNKGIPSTQLSWTALGFKKLPCFRICE